MKQIVTYIISLLAFYACIDEVALPVDAKFNYSIVDNDKTVPVDVRISNDTEGADTFLWTFKGGIPSTSTNRNPGIITYEEEGEYVIVLEASNRDGESETVEKKVAIKPEVTIGFTVDVLESNYAPVEVKITNTTTGASSYKWTFPGGHINRSNEQHPENIIFSNPGTYKITLEVTNGEEVYTEEQTIEVAPFLVSNFDYKVAFEDDDLQVPVKVSLTNTSVSATTYLWTIEGADITTSTDENLEVVFTTPGTYNMQLKASNGKDEKDYTRKITVVENTNLRTFEGVHFGINIAHKNDAIGACFSGQTRKIYSKSDFNDAMESEIDIVFFGLNENFSYNAFVSPDAIESVGFAAIPNAKSTKIINNLDSCNCNTLLSITDFDTMVDDSVLKDLTLDITSDGAKEFDNTVVPRLVVFETADGRKGVIKVNEFVKNAEKSYIVVDIKMQKESR